MIKSPITGSFNTFIVQSIPVSDIISLYQSDYNIDVRNYFNNLEKIELVQCRDSGYRFYYPDNIFGDDRFYQWFQQFDFYYSKDKWEYHITSQLIQGSRHVLEIGSGAGHLLDQLKAFGFQSITGLELNSDMVNKSKARGLDVVNDTIEDFATKNPGKYDVAYSLQVLEHIYDVKSFIDASLKALKPGGKLIFCVPNNNPYLHIHDLMHTLNLPPHHSGLWDKQTFLKLPDFYPVKMEKIYIEPLVEYVHWYKIQMQYLKEHNHRLYSLLSIVPRPIYKNVLKILRHTIKGRNILVEYSKI